MRTMWNFGVRVALLLMATALTVNAQSKNPPDVVNYIRGCVSYDDNKLRQGGRFVIGVEFYVAHEYGSLDNPFINSNQPFHPDLIPTSLEIIDQNSLDGVMLEEPDYPKATKLRRNFSKEPLSVFGGRNLIKMNGFVAPDMPVGRYEMTARLTYQPCKHSGCAAPTSKTVTIPFEIVDPKTKVHWDKWCIPRVTKGDLMLVPWRLIKGTAKCLSRGCS